MQHTAADHTRPSRRMQPLHPFSHVHQHHASVPCAPACAETPYHQGATHTCVAPHATQPTNHNVRPSKFSVIVAPRVATAKGPPIPSAASRSNRLMETSTDSDVDDQQLETLLRNVTVGDMLDRGMLNRGPSRASLPTPVVWCDAALPMTTRGGLLEDDANCWMLHCLGFVAAQCTRPQQHACAPRDSHHASTGTSAVSLPRGKSPLHKRSRDTTPEEALARSSTRCRLRKECSAIDESLEAAFCTSPSVSAAC